MKEAFKNLANLVVDGTVPPDRVLDGAKGGLSQVAVVGIDEKGELFVASSHKCETAHALLERGIKDLKERMI